MCTVSEHKVNTSDHGWYLLGHPVSKHVIYRDQVLIMDGSGMDPLLIRNGTPMDTLPRIPLLRVNRRLPRIRVSN